MNFSCWVWYGLVSYDVLIVRPMQAVDIGLNVSHESRASSCQYLKSMRAYMQVVGSHAYVHMRVPYDAASRAAFYRVHFYPPRIQ